LSLDAADPDGLVDAAFDGLRQPGADLDGATLLDSTFTDCDLAALQIRDGRLESVHFTLCLLTGATFSGARFRDVRFTECKLDEANFRMAVGEKVVFEDSVLTSADFYAASMPDAMLLRCDLTAVEFSKSKLAGSDLRGSRIDALRGGVDLAGVKIDSPQMIPLALSLFAALGIAIEDEER
jgi:uncharacterized protein YjbI with pentapeptide repeats